jgi:hypothetical protein
MSNRPPGHRGYHDGTPRRTSRATPPAPRGHRQFSRPYPSREPTAATNYPFLDHRTCADWDQPDDAA